MTCARCGGFEVFEHMYGSLLYTGFRCINCGAIRNIQVVASPPSRPREVKPQPHAKCRA
ncbi:hypothetical protein [Nitrospira moscoviensis]|uniref:Uncharacterized protein n=1 Tax=Nitrospira moscoviensis TaxID=42253 RepID=A0A0K2GE70_NITMO|nr:hypothetical protein [Nitrospira moscoviensis]ALA59159.1 hypothetical protein NITMOv2_2749 [Nitrospira moscoviensis]